MGLMAILWTLYVQVRNKTTQMPIHTYQSRQDTFITFGEVVRGGEMFPHTYLYVLSVMEDGPNPFDTIEHR